jgi:hypothetical protein
MNNVIGGFEDVFEKGKATVSDATKKTITDFANTTKSQLTGAGSSKVQTDKGSNEQAAASPAQNQQQMSDQDRVEFLRNLYGKSGDNKQNGKDSSKPQQQNASVSQALGIPQKDPNEGKTPEEIAKLEGLRRQLHSDYYQSLVNRPKSADEPVAEKLEREKQEEKFEEIEKQKRKPSPLPATVKQGTAESVVGVSG